MVKLKKIIQQAHAECKTTDDHTQVTLNAIKAILLSDGIKNEKTIKKVKEL